MLEQLAEFLERFREERPNEYLPEGTVYTLAENFGCDEDCLGNLLTSPGKEMVDAFMARFFVYLLNEGKKIEKYPEKVESVLTVIGENGWFVDIERPLHKYEEDAKLFTDGMGAHANQRLFSYFDENSLAICDRAIRTFPKREQLLRDVFWALNEKQYSLVMPLLISQIDGITNDFFGSLIFRQRDWKKNGGGILNSKHGEWTIPIYKMYMVETPFYSKYKHSETVRNSFNRHAIVHGYALDFGTKMNCLRYVSFLAFLESTLKAFPKGLIENFLGSSIERHMSV